MPATAAAALRPHDAQPRRRRPRARSARGRGARAAGLRVGRVSRTLSLLGLRDYRLVALDGRARRRARTQAGLLPRRHRPGARRRAAPLRRGALQLRPSGHPRGVAGRLRPRPRLPVRRHHRRARGEVSHPRDGEPRGAHRRVGLQQQRRRVRGPGLRVEPRRRRVRRGRRGRREPDAPLHHERAGGAPRLRLGRGAFCAALHPGRERDPRVRRALRPHARVLRGRHDAPRV